MEGWREKVQGWLETHGESLKTEYPALCMPMATLLHFTLCQRCIPPSSGAYAKTRYDRLLEQGQF